MKNTLIFCSLIFPAYAMATPEPCGPPGEYIDVGDTDADVIARCGQPTMAQKSINNVTSGRTERWYYTMNALEGTNQKPIIGATDTARYVVEFIDEKVNLIYSGDTTFDTYENCGISQYSRGEIQSGYTKKQVVNTCGEPNFTRIISQGTTTEVPIVTLTYQFDPTSPSTVVTIENGIVTNVE